MGTEEDQDYVEYVEDDEEEPGVEIYPQGMLSFQTSINCAVFGYVYGCELKYLL